MEHNYFQGTVDSPFHISIGGIVRNAENKVCCHYFKHFYHPSMGEFEDFYVLMRETIEPGETIESCLHRGFQEEFGIEGRMKSYLGSIVSYFTKYGVTVEKTTLYFLCDLVSFDESRKKADDPESISAICWLDPRELILKMKEQGKRLKRQDIDESAVLERLVGLG